MASAAYQINIAVMMNAGVNLGSDTIKVRLIRTSGYTFSQAHDFMDDVTAAIGTDVTLGSKTTTVGVFDAADAVFTAVSAGAAIDACVIYKFVTNDAASLPLVYLDGFSVVPNGGDITLVWASGSPNIWRIAP